MKPETPTPTESREMIALFQWAAYQTGKHPELAMMYHVGNERKCTVVMGAMLKRSGVKPGVPDICFPVARRGYHGMYIEMKRTSGGTVSADQRRWIENLQSNGYCAAVCKGWEEAAKLIEWYLMPTKEATC